MKLPPKTIVVEYHANELGPKLPTASGQLDMVTLLRNRFSFLFSLEVFRASFLRLILATSVCTGAVTG